MDKPPLAATVNRRSVKKIVLIVVAAVAIFAIGFAGVVLVASYIHSQNTGVPQQIVDKAKSTIYLPTSLPGKYTIDYGSFSVVEDSVVVFQANDGAGSNITFSEQPKVKDFNFDEFYKTRLPESKILNDVPYSSVWSDKVENKIILSVVTDDTWIMMVTTAPLSEDDLRRIAKSLQKV